MAAVSLSAVKDALHAWFVKGSGLPEGQVIWKLGARPPPSPYIHLTLKTSPIGHDWRTVAVDPAPGGDAIVTVHGMRRVVLVATCFDGDQNQGARSSDAILGDVVTSRYLPSVAAALGAARCDMLSVGEISSPGATIQSSYFEPRSSLEFRFTRGVEISEAAASIAEVELVQEP